MIQISGIEMSGIDTFGMEMSGMEMSGTEMSGTGGADPEPDDELLTETEMDTLDDPLLLPEAEPLADPPPDDELALAEAELPSGATLTSVEVWSPDAEAVAEAEPLGVETLVVSVFEPDG